MMAVWLIVAGLIVAWPVVIWAGRSAPRCTLTILTGNWAVGLAMALALAPTVPSGWLIVNDTAAAVAVLLLLRERAQLWIVYIFMAMLGLSAVHAVGALGDWNYITILTAGEALQIALVIWEAVDGKRKAVHSGRGGGHHHGAVATVGSHAKAERAA